MAINKVEYINNSSTAGFAIAGEEKVINNSSAQTIKKDVDEGNTEDGQWIVPHLQGYLLHSYGRFWCQVTSGADNLELAGADSECTV